ncbi:MAG: glycosyltransferase family 39 protein [Desulfurococcales archaeon]|nr:glycosyltransferase family 39 protein [Desulfurococcales archaeon]
MEDHSTKRFSGIVIWGFIISLIISLALLVILYQNAMLLSKNCSGVSCYVSDEVYYVNVARKILVNIFHIDRGGWWPSSSSIKPDYYNLEHPPLAKYFIGLSMLLFGDKPFSWRIPSIVFTAALPLLVYAAVIRYFNGELGFLAGVLAAVSLLFDPVVHTMGSLAMLDPYLAFFSALTFVLAVYDRKNLAGISLGLALSVKYSGYFLAPFIYVLFRLKGENPWKTLYYVFILPVIVLFILNIPLITHFGVSTWIDQSVIGAIEWHTTSRGPGPPASSPWGWLLNSNYFIMSFEPFRYPATVNSVVYIIALLSAIILLPMFMPGRTFYGVGALLSIWLGYVLTFIAGNHTLYSFYTIQLSPFVAIAFSETFIALYLLMEGKLGRLYRRNLKPYKSIIFNAKFEELPEEFSLLPWFTKDYAIPATFISAIAFLGGIFFMQKPVFLNDYTGIGCIINHGYPSDPIKTGLYNIIFATILLPMILQFYKPKHSDLRRLSPSLLLLMAGVILSSYNANSLLSPLILISVLYLYRNRLIGMYLMGLSAYSLPVIIGITVSAVFLATPIEFLSLVTGILTGIILAVGYCGSSAALNGFLYLFNYRNSLNIFNIIGGLTFNEQMAMLSLAFIVLLVLIHNKVSTIRKEAKNRPVNTDYLVLTFSVASIFTYSLTNMFSPERIAPFLLLLALYNAYSKRGPGFYAALASIAGISSVYIIPYSNDVSKILFKYIPSSGLDPFALHNIIGYLFHIVILGLTLYWLGERSDNKYVKGMDK